MEIICCSDILSNSWCVKQPIENKIESQLIYSWYKKALIITFIWNINILVLFNKIQQSRLKLSTNQISSLLPSCCTITLICSLDEDATSRASSWEWFFTPIKHPRSRVRRHLSWNRCWIRFQKHPTSGNRI